MRPWALQLAGIMAGPGQPPHRSPHVDQPLQQHRLEVIGSDAGGLASLPAAAAALVRQADLLAAPARLLPGLRQALAEELKPPELVASDRPEQLFPQLERALAAGRAVVLLASGDPLWFGIGRLLLGRFPPSASAFIPPPPACSWPSPASAAPGRTRSG